MKITLENPENATLMYFLIIIILIKLSLNSIKNNLLKCASGKTILLRTVKVAIPARFFGISLF